MSNNYAKIILILIILCSQKVNGAVTWEKMFCNKSTDCFRSVHEVSTGGYVLAGYTANFNSHDTDGFVVRMDNNGDTLWTYTYNGPNSHEDLFYKVLSTADGGFILCGYSRSFSNSDNALIVKLNSNGQFQWVKNWGGSGSEHPQDIVQLADGKYVLCGYTTSSPAHYYDAFILKLDQTGGTVWSKVYGGNAYDDAASLLALPGGGFILGGQSNNHYYLIRTNSSGDTLWTKTFGTTGLDKIECVNFAQGGNGYVFAGTTDGIGAGAEDAYLVKTDTSGNIIWAKTYGASLNDGFHRIESTSDGGYVAVGTSTQGALSNPNYWLVKLDANGNLSWQNCYGGNDHDHGYSGQQTSDGGYILTGHTHSFLQNTNNEDALVIKTNSSGQVSNELLWTTVTQLMSPIVTNCGSANAAITVEVANYGLQNVSNIPVTVEITGAITQTLTQTYTSSVAPNSRKLLTFNTAIDMSMGGTFNFHCYTGNQQDVIPAQNFLDVSLTVGGTLPPPVTSGSHCGPGTVILAVNTINQVDWYTSLTGGVSIGSGTNFTTPYISSNTTYYAEIIGGCQTARFPVDALITTSLVSPIPVDGSNCGTGTVTLSANSPYTVSWFSSSNSTTPLASGTTFTTPVLSSSTSYYVQADNASCTSNRELINAIIYTVPADPIPITAAICGSGIVNLSASSTDLLSWYDAASGGNLLGTGSTFTTPVISATTTYFVQAHNTNCSSIAAAATAVINPLPTVDLGLDTIYAGTSSYILDAGPGFSSYLWNTFSNSQNITTDTSGNYCVTVIDVNNCTASDCAFVEFMVGLNDAWKAGSFDIYPQPSHGIITVGWIDMHSLLHLSILDITGKKVYDNPVITNKESFDVSFLSKGIYVLQLSDSKSTLTKKLVIE